MHISDWVWLSEMSRCNGGQHTARDGPGVTCHFQVYTEYLASCNVSINKMEAFRRLIGAAPAKRAPARVETDDIYPLHMLDDAPTLRGIVVTWTLRFNDVLDPDRLHASLSRLLEIGDWRKAGGQLRLRDDNGEL